jgi:starch synthase
VKILLAASEAVPFCKTGGLADVVGALAQRLGALGHDVCLFLPKYRAVEAAALQGGIAQKLRIPLNGGTVDASLRYMQWRNVSVYFVDHPPFFDREGLYTREGKDHADNAERFALFSRGVLEGAKLAGFKPDVVHVHDWQTGLIPAYLKRHYASDPFYARTASILTVHNMAYQGNFPRAALGSIGFEDRDFTPEGLEYYGQVSYLKAGLVFADSLTTVSPAYAREIQESDERGFGFEGLLRRRSSDLHGILNGIDTDVWDPERDHHLARRYAVKDAAAGKAACKSAVRQKCGLAEDARKPLVGIVSRLDYQKGLDVAIQALENRLDRCQLAVVGTGDAALSEAFASLARRKRESVHFHSGFDDAFAHELYAASDLFLMPSRFEPCGLGQMIAMRYGSIPVATRTGGLADTVVETPAAGARQNGFLSEPGDAAGLGAALDRALTAHGTPAWTGLVQDAMRCDFSWDSSVARYAALYKEVAAKPRAAAA